MLPQTVRFHEFTNNIPSRAAFHRLILSYPNVSFKRSMNYNADVLNEKVVFVAFQKCVIIK
jgi:hypothetical protein